MKIGLWLTSFLWAQVSFHPQSFTYVLQADSAFPSREAAVQTLKNCGRDLVVIDYSYTAGRFGKWTKSEIESIRAGKPGRKVVAYLSIGEAENYRAYWRPIWAKAPPDFLLGMNPNWPGNFRVKYWDPDWQSILLDTLTEIILQGFDGVYLDIVDAFQTFEFNPKNNEWIEKRINPETKRSYRDDMVVWAAKIAKTARKQKRGFLIIPQNGSQLLENPQFAQTIDAIGLEDLFTEGNKKQPPGRIQEIRKFLEPLLRQKKPVLVMEYPTDPALQSFARQQAKKYGFVLLMTDRSLKTLGQAL